MFSGMVGLAPVPTLCSVMCWKHRGGKHPGESMKGTAAGGCRLFEGTYEPSAPWLVESILCAVQVCFSACVHGAFFLE